MRYMFRPGFVGAAFVFAVISLTVLQAVAAAPQNTSSAPASQPAGAVSVSIAGCVVRDRSGTDAAAAPFKLTKVQAGVAAGPTGPSNSNAPGTVTSGPIASPAARPSRTGEDGVRTMSDVEEYRLAAASGVDLAPHLNHHVRVDGTMPAEAPERQVADGPARPPIAGSSSPLIVVSNVTMLSAECP
jgi:hypothetical protein